MCVEKLLTRLEKVHERGGGRWLACCPHHDDNHPSLSIRQEGNGIILIHCFAGCSASDVMSAVGLTLADLYPDRPNVHHVGKLPDWKRKKLEDARDHELLILTLAASDRKNGKVISLGDKKRERLARRRLERINEVLDHG